MKAFASWSGGKDCMLAVHRFLNKPENSIECLLNMCDADGLHSRSHGIHKSWIQKQAACMNMPLIQPISDFKGYEKVFNSQIVALKSQGVEAGVFGDIYLEEHREWIDRVCNEMEIKALFPLWGEDTSHLLQEFINEGFETIVVAIRNDMLEDTWLGRIIENDFLRDIKKLTGIDPCAENGEYHSFVFNGPLFREPVKFKKGEIHREGNHNFIELK